MTETEEEKDRRLGRRRIKFESGSVSIAGHTFQAQQVRFFVSDGKVVDLEEERRKGAKR
jgi:hypothetical protein